MKGHLRERSPGHWSIVLDLHDADTGKRRRKWHSFIGNKRQAENECSRQISAMNSGSYLPPSKLTVANFLDQWLDHMRSQVAPRTFERYQEIARKNLVPILGSALLHKLRPEQVSAAYAKALLNGRRDGSGGLSPRTVHHMHRVLKQALRQAVNWDMLLRNPADAVKPPKVERAQIKALDTTDTALLIAHFRPTRMFVPVLLAVMCGLRRGEVAALKWRSVDLTSRQISVSESVEQTSRGVRIKDTKSGRSRTVALPSIVVDELRRHRLSQAEEIAEARPSHRRTVTRGLAGNRRTAATEQPDT